MLTLSAAAACHALCALRRCNTTPLQLGPLPLQLVEEIMRASGRELNADGTITTRAAGGGDGGGRSPVSAAASAVAGMMRSILVPRCVRARLRAEEKAKVLGLPKQR